MLENDKMETASTEVGSIWRRNDIENPRGELNNISSILKVESTTKHPPRINVIISTWISLSKSIQFARTFHVESRRRIDVQSTKMCPLGIFLCCVAVVLVFLYSCNSCRNHPSFETERHLSKNIFEKATVKIIKITFRVVVHFHFETHFCLS